MGIWNLKAERGSGDWGLGIEGGEVWDSGLENGGWGRECRWNSYDKYGGKKGLDILMRNDRLEWARRCRMRCASGHSPYVRVSMHLCSLCTISGKW